MVAIPAESVFGAVLPAFFLWFGGWLYFKIRHREGLGLGDVKLVAMVGSFLGLRGALLTLILGSISGSVIGYSYIKLTAKIRTATNSPSALSWAPPPWWRPSWAIKSSRCSFAFVLLSMNLFAPWSGLSGCHAPFHGGILAVTSRFAACRNVGQPHWLPPAFSRRLTGAKACVKPEGAD